MRTIRRLIEAKKIEREENGEAGFSLIELIIVVVILGILVAIAIPIFANIQATAQDNALKAAAANGATAAAAAVSDAPTTPTVAEAAASGGSGDIATELSGPSAATDAATVTNICVKATKTGYATSWFAGPGANAAGTACK